MSDRKKYLRTGIYRGIKDGAEGIDRKNKAIYGIAVMSKGRVKDDRGWEIDDMTLDQIVEYGNAHKLGIKSRFGHPNMSSTALGTFLGRTKNFRIDGNVARADLHFSDSAFRTPDGDLAGYVMSLAEQDPDAFGTSVVLKEYELEQQLDAEGNQLKDDKDEDLPPLLRIKGLSAADVVDDPAANEGIFGQKFFSDSVIPSAVMTQFLNKLVEDPDALDTIVGFLSRYQGNRDEIQEEKTSITPDEGKNTKEEIMDLKDLTLETVKTDRPDIADVLKREGADSVDLGKVSDEAVTKERTRAISVLGLLENEGYSKYFSIALEGVKDGSSLEAVESKMKDHKIADFEKSAIETPGPGKDEEDKPAEEIEIDETEERARKKFDSDPEIQKEFRKFETYFAYVRNRKKVRIFSGKEIN